MTAQNSAVKVSGYFRGHSIRAHLSVELPPGRMTRWGTVVAVLNSNRVRSSSGFRRTLIRAPMACHLIAGFFFTHLYTVCFFGADLLITQTIGAQIIPIDGKTVRQSFDRNWRQSAIHVISAWASEHRLVLGQLQVDSKSNEITAIPKLIELLDIASFLSVHWQNLRFMDDL